MLRKINVVIAEDEPVVLEYVQKLVLSADSRFALAGASLNGRELLKTICEKKPDIVITDILMPSMTGLNMIEEAKKAGIDAKFIVLTGYSEFDYALKSLRLGVSRFLLKPIDDDEVVNALLQLRDEIDAEDCRKIAGFIASAIAGSPPGDEEIAGMKATLFDAFAGPLTNRIYGEMGLGAAFFESADLESLKDFAQSRGVYMVSVPGSYPNEHIFAAAYGAGESFDALGCAKELMDHLKSDSTFLSIAVSPEVLSGKEYLDIISLTREYLFSRAAFGKDNLIIAARTPVEKKAPEISKAAVSLSELIAYSISPAQLETRLNKLLEHWKATSPSELSLLADIGFLIRRVAGRAGSGVSSILEPLDVISSSGNYDELYSSLLFDLKSTLSLHDDSGQPSDLARQVKKYLDDRFSEPINYKQLSEKFSYNEKYIASRFKEQYGVSPSKYVVHLRIDKAKRLLSENPDMLLKEVAQAVGYSDPLYFSRVFRDVTGMSPSSYAKSSGA